MATIRIKATPSDDLEIYTLWIDESDDAHEVPMDSDNEGNLEITGNCGDGSIHKLVFLLVGPTGATLKVQLFCGDSERGSTTLEIFEAPQEGGWEDFAI